LNREEANFLKHYAFQIGSLVSNFQSLELLIRIFLQAQPDAEPIGIPHGQDVYSVPVGSVVPACPLTNYDSLGTLIKKYNEIADPRGKPGIDPTLVEIRDALAHGRISARIEEQPMRLIKYSHPLKPQRTTVLVTFNAVLDDKWFAEQKMRVIVAMEILHGALLPQARTT
jgi:hypothetical protein